MLAPRLAMALAALAGCSACIWLPQHGQFDQESGPIPAAARAQLVPGQATRADVLCQLGEPEWHSADDSRFVYATREVQSTMIAYIVVDAAQTFYGEDRFELCEFDASGVLLGWREARRSFETQGAGMRPLSTAECEKLFPAAVPGS